MFGGVEGHQEHVALALVETHLVHRNVVHFFEDAQLAVQGAVPVRCGVEFAQNGDQGTGLDGSGGGDSFGVEIESGFRGFDFQIASEKIDEPPAVGLRLGE